MEKRGGRDAEHGEFGARWSEYRFSERTVSRMRARRGINDVEHLLPRVRKIVEEIYGERLVEVILYGSFARNRATPDSDIDILIVLKGEVDTIREMSKIHDEVYEIELETGELISVYPVAEEEFNNSIWPLYYHVKREGVKI